MDTSALILVVAVVVVLVWSLLFGGRLPRPYFHRSCQGKGWRRAFPRASKHEIRAFLDTFVDAFAFERREKLKLSPGDRILDIYRALYPSKWMADSLEVETLASDLEAKYRVTLGSVWSESLTLGELFAHVHKDKEGTASA
jgi:propanediol dehydratase small subunit